MIIVKIYLGISLDCCRRCGVSSVSDSSLFQFVNFFSRSIGPCQCLVNVKYRVLICFTCCFQSGSPFIYFGFPCLKVSSLLISALTQGEKVVTCLGSLVHLCCGEEGTLQTNKYHWSLGVLTVSGPHWVCPAHGSVCFPGLHCSGSRLLCRGTVQNGHCLSCPSQV